MTTTQATLSLSSDENATCRYSTAPGVAYWVDGETVQRHRGHHALDASDGVDAIRNTSTTSVVRTERGTPTPLITFGEQFEYDRREHFLWGRACPVGERDVGHCGLVGGDEQE